MPKNNIGKTAIAIEIGKRLASLREAYGVSIGNRKINMHEFGRALGFTTNDATNAALDNYISRLEKGDLAPNAVDLQRYSQLCHVSIDYIVSGSDYETPKTEISLADMLEELTKLDDCGLIDIVNDGERRGILFRNITDDRWLPDNVTDKTPYNAERIYYATLLRTFISNYSDARSIATLDLPNSKNLSKLTISSVLDNFEQFGGHISADQLLSKITDA